MPITQVELKNFTVFADMKLDFSSGVNVIIGDNGAGKTHLLKALYAVCEISRNKKITDTAKYFSNNNDMSSLFRELKPLLLKIVMSDQLTELKKAYVAVNLYLELQNGKISEVPGTADNQTSFEIHYPSEKVEAVFIPAKDMLTHANGLLTMAKKYGQNMPFDKTLLDIIEKATAWKLNDVPSIALKVIPKLEKLIGGTIVVENDNFYIQKESGENIEFAVEAEGVKKIGLLWQLLMNESIKQNSILFWDEPESNINPKIIPEIVEILLELSRQGVQIFVSTHDYIFAKYFEIRCKTEDKMMFHSLYNSELGIIGESNKKFRDLKHNSIMQAFEELLDEVFDKNLGD